MIPEENGEPSHRINVAGRRAVAREDSVFDTGDQRAAEKVSGPRSRVMDSILVMLYAKPMRSSDIAREIGKSSKYVSSYLSYWRVRGVVEYINGFWYLTPRGEELARSIIDQYRSDSRVDEILRLAHHIIRENVFQTKNNKKEKEFSVRDNDLLSFTVEQTYSGNPQEWDSEKINRCIGELLARKPLNEDEKATLRAMIRHHIVWGSTYIYLDQLAEELETDINTAVRIVRSLQSKHLLYLYQDPKLGFRIGLSKTLKKLIHICRSEKASPNA